jgi:hypothetical protein
MTKLELEHRLTVFVMEQPVDRFEISDSVEADLQVELTLKPNTPITERFIVRLEIALHRKIGSLSLFRVRRNVLIIRFTLKDGYRDDSAADRIQELPFAYTCADVVIRTKSRFRCLEADLRTPTLV